MATTSIERQTGGQARVDFEPARRAPLSTAEGILHGVNAALTQLLTHENEYSYAIGVRRSLAHIVSSGLVEVALTQYYQGRLSPDHPARFTLSGPGAIVQGVNELVRKDMDMLYLVIPDRETVLEQSLVSSAQFLRHETLKTSKVQNGEAADIATVVGELGAEMLINGAIKLSAAKIARQMRTDHQLTDQLEAVVSDLRSAETAFDLKNVQAEFEQITNWVSDTITDQDFKRQPLFTTHLVENAKVTKAFTEVTNQLNGADDMRMPVSVRRRLLGGEPINDKVPLPLSKLKVIKDKSVVALGSLDDQITSSIRDSLQAIGDASFWQRLNPNGIRALKLLYMYNDLPTEAKAEILIQAPEIARLLPKLPEGLHLSMSTWYEAAVQVGTASQIYTEYNSQYGGVKGKMRNLQSHLADSPRVFLESPEEIRLRRIRNTIRGVSLAAVLAGCIPPPGTPPPPGSTTGQATNHPTITADSNQSILYNTDFMEQSAFTAFRDTMITQGLTDPTCAVSTYLTQPQIDALPLLAQDVISAAARTIETQQDGFYSDFSCFYLDENGNSQIYGVLTAVNGLTYIVTEDEYYPGRINSDGTIQRFDFHGEYPTDPEFITQTSVGDEGIGALPIGTVIDGNEAVQEVIKFDGGALTRELAMMKRYLTPERLKSLLPGLAGQEEIEFETVIIIGGSWVSVPKIKDYNLYFLPQIKELTTGKGPLLTTSLHLADHLAAIDNGTEVFDGMVAVKLPDKFRDATVQLVFTTAGYPVLQAVRDGIVVAWLDIADLADQGRLGTIWRELPLNTPLPTVQAPQSTETPTAIPTPTETPKPTEVPRIPEYTWESPITHTYKDWINSWDDPSWSNLTDSGGDVSMKIVDHPTLGEVYEFTVIHSGDTDNPIRMYLDKKGKRLDYPVDWEMEEVVMFSQGFIPEYGNASIISNFLQLKPNDPFKKWRPIVGIDATANSVTISILDPHKDAFWARYTVERSLLPNIEYKIRVYTKEGIVYLSVNDSIWVKGPLHPDQIGMSPVMVHSGAYGFGSLEESKLYNGPLKVRLFKIIP